MTRMHRWRTATLIALLLAALALALDVFTPSALAQSTGGSFGGGDWGGGGSSGGGGGYSSGSSRDHDGSSFFLLELVFIAFRINPIFGLLVLGIVVAIFFARVSSRGGGSNQFTGGSNTGSSGYSPPPFLVVPQATAPSPDSRAWMGADVTQVRLALDVAARPQIEAALDALMRSVDVRTRHGLLLVVHRVAGVLRQNERAWRLGGESNYHPMSPPQAAGVFQQLAAAGRARAAEAVGSSTDPSGVFFITLLVAAKREIVDFHAHRPEQMRMILDDLGRLTEQELVSAEVYWLPLKSGTGMSVDEVRRLHPDMKPIEHAVSAHAASAFAPSAAAPGAPVPRAPFCPHCGKQMLLRLPHCEHCGAPRP